MLEGQYRGLKHWLYDWIPVHRDDLSWTEPHKAVLWALFGNDDDGIFGEGPHSGRDWLDDWGSEISLKRFAAWQLRNPLHNFMFYAIGRAGTPNLPSYTILEIGGEGCHFMKRRTHGYVFPQHANCLYVGLHGWLPFVSIRAGYGLPRRLDMYIGWRERGNFGTAFRFKKRKSN